MTAPIIFLASFMVFLVGAMCWIDSQLPTEEEEEAQGKRDVEEMLQRANRETQDRRRVRAGNQWGLK